MSIQIRLRVEADVDEHSDLIELLEELNTMALRLGADIVSDYRGQQIAISRPGQAFVSREGGGYDFYRRTARRGWVSNNKEVF